MNWDYSFSARALKQLKKLDRETQHRIINWLDERVVDCQDPRQWGKALKGELAGLWRYRVGSYRVVCQLIDDEVVVLVLRLGHRKQVYE